MSIIPSCSFTKPRAVIPWYIVVTIIYFFPIRYIIWGVTFTWSTAAFVNNHLCIHFLYFSFYSAAPQSGIIFRLLYNMINISSLTLFKTWSPSRFFKYLWKECMISGRLSLYSSYHVSNTCSLWSYKWFTYSFLFCICHSLSL